MRLRSLLIALLAVALLVPATIASAEAPSLPDGAVPRADGTYAIELKTETPDWYTAQLHDRVVAAGKRGQSVPIPNGVNVPASGLAFTGIRPGSWIIFPAGCTTNFVFGGGTSIGTAGHCANVGDEVTIIAAPGVLMNIGTVGLSRNNGIGDDFALINIYPAMQQYVNPSMAHWAGPTGAAAPQFGDAVVHSGHGLVIGAGGTPRAGVVTYTGPGDHNDPSWAYGWDGAASPGDSGSGVRNVAGAAAGNLTHLVVGTDFLPAFIAGTTITRMQQLAGGVATASLVPDPLF
ncbi:MAG: hypothetical protein ACRDKZ_08770 [Actinomycetota bacterium]